MSAVLESPLRTDEGPKRLGFWMPILIGLGVLYLPTWYSLGNTIWRTEEQGHGPIILGVAAWMLWGLRGRFTQLESVPAPLAGWTTLGLGLLFYVLGRSQDIILLEVGSQILVGGAVLLLGFGWQAVRVGWFPLFFLGFMVPVPGFIIDALTGPLKHHVSLVAESMLYAAGYPVARSGVVLSVGQYQLFVADACSGLNSMFSLSALGVLYVYVTREGRWWKNAILLASVLPIAFTANTVRVMILVLVTYHFGEAAGQGSIHEFAGMILFVIALCLLFGLDSSLRLLARPASRSEA